MASNFRFEDNSGKVLSALDSQLEKALEACGLLAEGYAKSNLTSFPRVDTGNLRNSVTHMVGRESVQGTDMPMGYVGTNVEYASYVEYGTGPKANGTTADGQQIHGRQDVPWFYKDMKGKWHASYGMKPSHFLKKALSDHKAEYIKILENYLKGG